MTMAHDLIIDQFASMVDRQAPLTTWYAQGHSDGLGDRLLMFDNTSAPSWEILRFAPALARDHRFEAALRDRVARLASFHHPAFPLVRPIKEIDDEDGLAVVSTYTAGVRLSEALKKPRSAAFAMRLIRQLLPALSALQQSGAGIAHGALDADRIVVTANGQLMIREHMVGAALGSLELASPRLWADFGILASPSRTTAPTLDSRSDVTQLGLVALSLMAGRRIGPDEYPHEIEGLLDDIAERGGPQAPGIFQPLRSWLERALQLEGDLFDSARDANDALAELREEPERSDDHFVPLGWSLADASHLAEGLEEAGGWRPGRRGPHLIAPRRVDVAAEQPVPPVVPADLPAVGAVGPVDNARRDAAVDRVAPLRSRFPRAIRWMAVATAGLAIGEGLLIGRLLYARAVTPPAKAATVVNDPPAAVGPQHLNAGPPASAAGGVPDVIQAPSDRRGPDIQPAPKPKEQPAKQGDRAVVAPPALIGSQRSGGFRLTSTVEVHVLDGDRVLGSSGDGPIVAPAGSHEFEFVNSAIGYRERRVVDIKPGQVTAISVVVPNGTLNINAVPWASIWIDGNSFGETPLGNLSVAPGEHEIVFRHPQLGERREKSTVRANGTTRVSVNLNEKK